ncbi:Rne/Rng family ribonuclease [Kordiimonas sp. SCSIO 12610]|uniref:Rne/Rng family ribonuclease n=1 Tax=Kordiimonas sp. SCSIO 12610 TaxID=2829597 RepID=UPI00210B111C|nr:Rne/Rng family ribonuclease [Kordiimonas sp. SCSIO 12610]UTW53844.1 Rne/Rng family ribonuclease [Kordiimonas sp. SCSIO 12610]
MSTRMLIDARHSEETRVTIVKGNRVEDFDYESSTRRQLKGNIYLARVTRIEPSLQAAFVEYGGNRHGFLAFSEIHPDYYQIPAEDRAELVAAELAAIQQQQAEEDAAFEKARSKETSSTEESEEDTEDNAENNTVAEAASTEVITEEVDGSDNGDSALDTVDDNTSVEDEDSSDDEETSSGDEDETEDNSDDIDDEAEEVETQETDDAERDQEIAEARARRYALKAMKRKYSIQEVIKKRQVLLIQVAKEERGNKGAALTTYLSLAGRYCVLMPNSTHSGGISRKISNSSDRRKLKSIINSLNVDDDMGLIIRTAGLKRTKSEIKRDYEYLLRLWNEIRDLTLQSIAPTLVYEEANLIKRTIRDQYTRDIDEVLVEGERGYRAAKDFMKLLMPSHSKKVQHYKDHIPLFHRYQVESHLEAMYQPIVQLKSGGYIVINPTEALISIDVNSGRSTKEHNIEETAIKTNLEAAEEVARQLKLRDMAGLVVIDFIDMEERSNNRAVERRMKEVLKSDRARIQVGRISSFGLMEMSRQRLRPNLLEASMETCPSCEGTGVVRSIESAALTVLRNLEEEGIRARSSVVRVTVCPDVAVYLLNKKRKIIADLEKRYNFYVEVLAKSDFGPSNLEITREAATAEQQSAANAAKETVVSIGSIDADETDGSSDGAQSKSGDNDSDKPQRKRRRRRRKRRGDDNRTDNQQASDVASNDEEPETTEADSSEENNDENKRERSRRRRGRRGGRNRNRQDRDQQQNETSGENETDSSNSADASDAAETSGTNLPSENEQVTQEAPSEETDGSQPKPRRRRVRKPKAEKTAEVSDNEKPTENADSSEETPSEEKPRRRRRRVKKSDDSNDAQLTESEAKSDSPEEASTSEEKPKRKPRTRRKKTDDNEGNKENTVSENAGTDTEAKTEEAPKPRRRRSTKKAKPEADSADSASRKEIASAKTEGAEKSTSKSSGSEPVKTETEPKAASAPKPEAKSVDDVPSEDKPKRKGWWQRTFG